LVVPDTRFSQHIASCSYGIASAAGRSGVTFPGISYLRMVIVTTAVYWRLSSELRSPKATNPSP